MTGEEEGSGVMPMYTRLVPAAARSGAQSDCSTSSPIFTGLARLHLTGEILHTGVTAKHWYNSSMGTTPDPSSSSLVKWLAYQTMSDYDMLQMKLKFS